MATPLESHTVVTGIHDGAGSDEIYKAVKAGDVHRVKGLLARNPDLVKAKDAHGTPLHEAVSAGHKEMVEVLYGGSTPSLNGPGLPGTYPRMCHPQG